jgi:mannose-6-phosphate isomerase-like protein (cupin superfamily)
METIYNTVKDIMTSRGYTTARIDLERPWGGFVVLEEEDAAAFRAEYFPDVEVTGRITPKYLLIAPGKRLSWQYHSRRSEHWCVIQGRIGVMRSVTDEMPDAIERLDTGESIALEREERHRIIGLDEWAIVVEIWKHVDPSQPSDEADIVRVQDDFAR